MRNLHSHLPVQCGQWWHVHTDNCPSLLLSGVEAAAVETDHVHLQYTGLTQKICIQYLHILSQVVDEHQFNEMQFKKCNIKVQSSMLDLLHPWHSTTYHMAGNFGGKIFWRIAEIMTFGEIYFGSWASFSHNDIHSKMANWTRWKFNRVASYFGSFRTKFAPLRRRSRE